MPKNSSQMYFYAADGGTPTPYMGAHWRHLANTAAAMRSCQITLTTCYIAYTVYCVQRFLRCFQTTDLCYILSLYHYHTINLFDCCIADMCVTRKQWHKYESLVIYQPTDRLSNRIDDRFRRVWQSDLFRCNNLANVAFNILYITAANEKVLIVIVSINIGTL